MYSEDMIQDLNKTISCQKEKICKLNKKLEEFDTVVSERNDLRESYKEFEQHIENIINGHKKAFAELSAMCDEQAEKLKKVANAEYQCELKNGKLEDANNCMSRQMKILKCNESKLQSQLAEIETTLKCVQNELCTTKSELEEKNSMVNKLKANLKCNEKELCNIRRELEECKTECKKSYEKNEVLKSDLDCTKKNLCETKQLASQMEEKFLQERETLTNELKLSCKKNNELESRYDEAMYKLNDERCKSKKFAAKLIELNKLSAKNHLEMKNRVQKLQDEICAKNNELGCLKKKVIELQQDNDCKCLEINELKNKLNEREGQLKQMCLLSEKIEQIKCHVESSCPKKKCEPNSCCPKKKCEPPSPCCPKKKSEPPSSCCQKKKCETSPCCQKKKCETNPCSHKQDNSMTDMSCPLSDNTKAVIQKYATNLNNDGYKTELKKLKCELEDLQQSVGYIAN